MSTVDYYDQLCFTYNIFIQVQMYCKVTDVHKIFINSVVKSIF
jgi:hypothetical protein